MSKLFMYGTSLEGIEQLMVLVPNFQPRRSGIVINNYFNCKGGVIDCNCNVINVSNRCNDCGYIHSGILFDMDKVGYKDLVRECFGKIKSYSLRGRLKLLTNNFKGELFLNNAHKERFYNELHKQNIDINDIPPKYIATLFLLTTDDMLWKALENSVKPNGFDFSHVHLKQISTDGYAIYQTAKTISTGKECIRINEIADEDLINDITFKAIINSALITRYGADVFLITK
ncbi:hypothetical protein KQI38_06090 [Tissierella carlieri]|uniref:hypothetical protein n=1 Tax=Tissierella carlieri TaxID=689904 RepID=UPI001C126038|nr:hypothetical protein [Tissierella carlieri]MBU5311592.1 hypothetical protein [Tissierella carlieri]